MPREQREQSLGSGVIVNPDGYVLTNNHAIEGATEIKVFLPDKRDSISMRSPITSIPRDLLMVGRQCLALRITTS